MRFIYYLPILVLSWLISHSVTISAEGVKCKRGKGQIITQQRPVETFTDIEAGDFITVNIKYGNKKTIEVTDYENLIQHLKTEVAGSTLKIYYDIPCVRNSKNTVTVWVKDLNSISAKDYTTILVKDKFPVPIDKLVVKMGDYSDFKIQGFIANYLQISAQDFSDINLDLDRPIKSINARIGDFGDIKIKGQKTEFLFIEAQDYCDVNTKKIKANNVTVTIGDFSDANINAQKIFNIEYGDFSDIDLFGKPEIVVKKNR